MDHDLWLLKDENGPYDIREPMRNRGRSPLSLIPNTPQPAPTFPRRKEMSEQTTDKPKEKPTPVASPFDQQGRTERHFRRSASIGSLAAALAKAQGEIKGAVKDAANPYFKSKYADLASVRDACAGPLAANGLAVIQFPRATDAGVEVETLLCHASGEWVSEILTLPVSKADAQGVGSAITYARRYALASFAGVAPEDDDGNAAADSAKTLRDKGLKILTPAADKGIPSLELAWKTISPEMRVACKNDLTGLKERAAKVIPSREPGSDDDATA